MKTELSADFLATPAGKEANRILRACVHCGFCNATCPTYQLERNELDGPRGRIYLIKSMLEGGDVSQVTRTHMDRCLACQSCETTCPSGVDYQRLLDIGRREVEEKVPRSRWQQLLRKFLLSFMSRRQWFTPAARLGRRLRFLVPPPLADYLSPPRILAPRQTASFARQVVLVQGCVQPGLSPETNRAAAFVLAHFGIETLTVAAEQCCGAMAGHLSQHELAAAQARANIDAWRPCLQRGAEAIVMTASGCSNFVREYEHLLSDDAEYAGKAAQIQSKLRDISELLVSEDLESLNVRSETHISWHCPCTAQHGQKLDEPTRSILTRLGFGLPAVKDAHLCCGSAGTYSLLQPKMARQLRQQKLKALQRSEPDAVVTANIGCQAHLGGGTQTPVIHWIELLAAELQAKTG